MSPTLSRVILASTILAATPPVYVLSLLAIEASQPPLNEVAFLATDLSVAAVFAVVWILVWRRNVIWTPTRRRNTLFVTLISVVVAVVVGAAYSVLTRVDEMGLIAGALTWLLVWVPGTAWIWKSHPLELVAKTRGPDSPLPCPQCGYDLRGLTQARCPECGTEYTLDELIAALTEANHKTL